MTADPKPPMIPPPGGWLIPATGETPAHRAVMAGMAQGPVVLLGERHDRADNHRWQMQVAAGLLAHRERLVMGFEMFPARLDPVLDAWVAGDLSEEAFLERAEWGAVWGFAAELYMPLFHFCRLHQVPMRGLNCRRDLVREVGAGGWESVPDEAREGLTPAAPASAAYRRYLFEVTGGGRPGRKAASPEDPAFDRFVRAQQTWDRAFACRIAQARARDPEALVLGIIGRGHLEYRGGTPAQLADLGIPDARVLLPHEGDCPVAPGLADAVFGLVPLPAGEPA